jgi:hypothetical protein
MSAPSKIFTNPSKFSPDQRRFDLTLLHAQSTVTCHARFRTGLQREFAHRSAAFIYYASFATSDQRKNLPKIVLPNFGDMPSGAQPIPSADEVSSATKGYRRVWLVLNFSSISYTALREAAVPVIWSTLLEEFDLSQREQIGVFLVSLFVRK